MAIYNLSTLGTSSNRLVFNDFDYIYQKGVLFRIQRRQPTRREIREFDIPLPESSGIADYQTYVGKSYLVIEGTMYPDDEAFYDIGREQIRTVASLVNQQADGDSDSGYVPYSWSETGGQRTMFVKVMYVDIPEQASAGIVQPFRLLCKVKNPVMYGDVLNAIVGASTATGASGAGYPFQYPVAYGSSAFISNGGFNNPGRVPSYPSIIINGPVNKPRLTLIQAGQYIEVDVNMNAGDSLIINYDQDSAPSVMLNGISVYAKLTSGSTFFKVKPGQSDFSLTGNSIAAGMRAQVSINPAYAVS